MAESAEDKRARFWASSAARKSDFCSLCGTLQKGNFTEDGCVQCPFCKSKRPIEASDTEPRTSSISGRDMRRNLGLPPTEEDKNYYQQLMFDSYRSWKVKTHGSASQKEIEDLRKEVEGRMEDNPRIRIVSGNDWENVQEVLADFENYRPNLAVFANKIGTTTWTEIRAFASALGCPFVDARDSGDSVQSYPPHGGKPGEAYDIGHYMQNLHCI